jgi:DNA-binding transcriptional MerR regulator
MSSRSYLSIGEVLAVLRDEFPDVTISKIRFLEAQGLIEPERTPSGYRKFHEPDVERLRWILREQTVNFLPLKVIKERLEDGTTGGMSPSAVELANQLVATIEPPRSATLQIVPAVQPTSVADEHETFDDGDIDDDDDPVDNVERSEDDVFGADVASLSRKVTRRELLKKTQLSEDQLDELEDFGVVTPQVIGGDAYYSPGDVRIVGAAARLQQYGLGGRHLRAAKMATDREVGLYEQIAAPYMRTNSSTARDRMRDTLLELIDASSVLHAELLRAALFGHIGPDSK